MPKGNKNLFQRLTALFKSGPVVKRKIRGFDTAIAVPDTSKSSGALFFQKSISPTYATITSNAYNLSERLMRYDDFASMEYTPEIAAALDLYADETFASDDKGIAFHVYSENEKIKETLEDLFYNTLNIEFMGRSLARNVVKFGDFFWYIDVHPEQGVINALPIPVNEIEREENYDPNDPFAVRFRWVTLGNRTLENWEVAHFRLLGNDAFLPYGSSVIEPARRIWRQMILIEDAMLVYRIVRAPERRVFYIDVANVPAENVPMYVEEVKKNLRTNQVIDRDQGRVDLRYNAMSVDEDYFIAVRGSETGTRIDTLAGGQNTAAVEDVEYIQKKLISALKVPRAYLGYEDALSSKATLAQMDIRFSRTISIIQKTIISELNKIAIIHLYANGFDGEDLQNFTLHLSNPSTIAQQQKLELWRTKLEIAGSLPEGYGAPEFVMREIWGLTSEDINLIKKQQVDDAIFKKKLEDYQTGFDEPGGDAGGSGGGDDLFGDLGGGGDEASDEGGEDTLPPEENAGDAPEEEQDDSIELLTSAEDFDDDEDFAIKVDLKELDKPIKPKSQLSKSLYNRSRRRTHGSSKTGMPDFKKMTSNNDEDGSMSDPYDNNWLKSTYTNPFGESVKHKRMNVGLSPDIKSTLTNMSTRLGISRSSGILTESEDAIEIDLDIEE